MLVLNLVDKDDGNLYTAKTIVLDLGRGGSRKTTPSQQEGPYYPVQRFFDLGPDLTAGIGEYGTIFPSWGASGTWFPTGTTDFPTTFAPTEEEIIAPTEPPVNPTSPPTSPPVATNTTTAPITNATSPPTLPPTTGPVTVPPVVNATKPPTVPPTIKPTSAPPTKQPTNAPTGTPPTVKPTVAAQTPPPTPAAATQPPLLTNSTSSPQQTVIGSNATAPSPAPNTIVTVFPTNAPQSEDTSKDQKPQKEKANSVSRRMLRRALL